MKFEITLAEVMSFLLAASLIAFWTFFSSLSISSENPFQKKPKHAYPSIQIQCTIKSKQIRIKQKKKKRNQNKTGADQKKNNQRLRRDYLGFGVQCCDTLDGVYVANLSIAAVGLALASECSSPSPLFFFLAVEREDLCKIVKDSILRFLLRWDSAKTLFYEN